MTGFDLFACALLVASALLGWARGLIREVLSLIAYGAAFAAAIWWGPMLYSWLAMIDTAMLRMVLAYGGVFVVVLLSIGLFNMAKETTERAVKCAQPSHIDQGAQGHIE